MIKICDPSPPTAVNCQCCPPVDGCCQLMFITDILLYAMHRDHSFPRQISQNSAGQFAKFRGSPRQKLLIPRQPICMR